MVSPTPNTTFHSFSVSRGLVRRRLATFVRLFSQKASGAVFFFFIFVVIFGPNGDPKGVLLGTILAIMFRFKF